MIIRLMLPQEQDTVTAIAKSNRATKEFPNLWTRWDHWAAQPPIVAVSDDQIVGLHVVTFGKRAPVYANSYYQLVIEAFRGKGVAGDMVRFLINSAIHRECGRLKFKVPHDSDGQKFWMGFGFIPFGEDYKHYLFDIDLSGTTNFEDILKDARARSGRNMPPDVVERYTNSGVDKVIWE